MLFSGGPFWEKLRPWDPPDGKLSFLKTEVFEVHADCHKSRTTDKFLLLGQEVLLVPLAAAKTSP